MVRAYVLVTATAGKALEVVERLQGELGIIKADAITGEYDAVVQVEAEDVRAIGRLIVEKVQAGNGVVKTVTCLVV